MQLQLEKSKVPLGSLAEISIFESCNATGSSLGLICMTACRLIDELSWCACVLRMFENNNNPQILRGVNTCLKEAVVKVNIQYNLNCDLTSGC